MMIIKKNLLWILLFGSLIGLNETLTGSFSFPYRAVLLCSIDIALLSFARHRIPKAGSTMMVILIALLFKVNNLGLHSCSANVLLCGPTAVLMLGMSYELFAGLFTSKSAVKLSNWSVTCALTAMVAFSLFAVMNTCIIRSWSPGRLVDYIFIKGTLTAIASSVITIVGLFAATFIKNKNFGKLNPYYMNGVLGVILIGLWLFGSLTNF